MQDIGQKGFIILVCVRSFLIMAILCNIKSRGMAVLNSHNVGAICLIFLIKHLCLIIVWVGEDQRQNIIKTY